MRDTAFRQLLNELREGLVPSDQIGTTIVRLAKPLNQARIREAQDVVASYLAHSDSWVRHEAMWFLTSWGKLTEFQPALLRALRSDPEPDNRAFAALCLAHLRRGSRDTQVLDALREVVEDEREERLTRLSAYGALLEVGSDKSGADFQAYEKDLRDIDWDWVRSLHPRE